MSFDSVKKQFQESGAVKRMRPAWMFLRELVHQYNDKGCRQQAAALTYMTLFAIVPTLTVVFTMFSLFPAFEGLETELKALLFKHLLPGSGLDVESYLDEFIRQARSLTLAGLLILVATAYFMIKNIEQTFNGIWGVTEARKGVANFLLYWAVLSLGPLLLGVGLAMSTYLLSLKLFESDVDSLGVIPMLLRYFPWFLTTFAFTLLFAAVPNCKVSVKHAAIGGLVTAICFELFKDLFGWIVTHSSYKAVYGAFAIVPLFLMWVYILWMIVLGGAVLVRSISTYYAKVSGKRATDLLACLNVLWFFWGVHQSGGKAKNTQLIKLGLSIEQWHRIRKALISANVIAETHQDAYVLSRSLHTLTLGELTTILGVQTYLPSRPAYLREQPWFDDAVERLESIDEYTAQQLDITVARLFQVNQSTVFDEDIQERVDLPTDDSEDLDGSSEGG